MVWFMLADLGVGDVQHPAKALSRKLTGESLYEGEGCLQVDSKLFLPGFAIRL